MRAQRDWPKRRLDELTESARPITYGVVKPGDHDDLNGVRFIRGGDIAEGKINIANLRTITSEVSAGYKRTLLRGGELVVSLVGNPGEAAVVPASLAGANIARQAGLVALRDDVDSRYVMYFLRSPGGRAELFAQTTGSVQQVINLANLKNIRVPLPDLSTQRKIAGILSAYDDLIENNLRRIKILEEMAQTLYREWFVHFRFPGHESVPLVDSPLGPIPHGWEAKAVEELLDFHIGGGWGKDSADDQHTEPASVIRGTDIPDARLRCVEGVPSRYHSVANLRSRKLKIGDIVFEVSGGSKGQPVGRSLFIDDRLLSQFRGEDVMCASFCKLLRPRSDVLLSELLLYHLLEIYEDGRIDAYQVQSTGITNFRFAPFLEKEIVLVPPGPLQIKWRVRSDELLRRCSLLGVTIQNLRKTRDLLLPKLLNPTPSRA